MSIKSTDKILFKNTFFLYLLTFSGYFFSVATVPYLTRTLGAVAFGKTGVATAYMSYVTIIMDLGFILSATQKVVEHKTDALYIRKLLYSVFIIKIIVGFIISFFFLTYVFFNPIMRQDFIFYALYLAAYIINSFLPDFFYRGIEKMKIITIRTLLVKGLFMCLIFAFVDSPKDYWKVPFITLLGNTIAVLLTYFDLFISYRMNFEKATRHEIYSHIKDTLPFFSSRIASTFYQAMNTIVLSSIYGNSKLIGYYTSADKIITLSKTGSSPIADSLYPYMIRNKNFKLVKRILLIFMPVICFFVCLLFIYAESICIYIFGNEYADTANILRCLLPIMVVILPTYIICFPVMVPLGLSKYANKSNSVGVALQICGLIILWAFNNLTIYNLCILTSISEIGVFLYRISIIVIYKYKPKILKYRTLNIKNSRSL